MAACGQGSCPVGEVSGPPADAPKCEKCGQPTTLFTVIQRLGKQPGYRLFHCEACNVLQWVAEKVSDADKSA